MWSIKTKESQIVKWDHDQFTKNPLEKDSVQTSSQSFDKKKMHMHNGSNNSHTDPNVNAKTLQQLIRCLISGQYEQISDCVDFKRLQKLSNVELKQFKECVFYGQVQAETKKMHGLGVMLYTNGRVYEGQWAQNAKNGLAFQRFANKSTYKGTYVNGKPHGKGKFEWQNGEIYQGQWQDGLKNGSGIWRGSKGDSYIGEWRNGKADGYGVHTWVNGDRYEGEFKECLKHGEGIEKFANGDMYNGSYVDGHPQGQGEYHWANGSYFKGQFKKSLRNGVGLWKKSQNVPNSDMYEGAYKDDKKQGYGMFTWENGSVYKGNYKDDLRHGYGQMFWIDGSVYKGQWEFGQQSGENLYIEEASPEGLDNQGFEGYQESTNIQKVQGGRTNELQNDRFNPEEYFEFHAFDEPNHPEVPQSRKFRARDCNNRLVKSKNQNRSSRNDISAVYKGNFVTESVFHHQKTNKSGGVGSRMTKKNSGISFKDRQFQHCKKRNNTYSRLNYQKIGMEGGTTPGLKFSQAKGNKGNSAAATSTSFYMYNRPQKFHRTATQSQSHSQSAHNIPRHLGRVKKHDDFCELHGTRMSSFSRPLQQRQAKSSNGVRSIGKRRGSSNDRDRDREDEQFVYWDVNQLRNANSNGGYKVLGRQQLKSSQFNSRVNQNFEGFIGERAEEDPEEDIKWFTRSKNRSQYF